MVSRCRRLHPFRTHHRDVPHHAITGHVCVWVGSPRGFEFACRAVVCVVALLSLYLETTFSMIDKGGRGVIVAEHLGGGW